MYNKPDRKNFIITSLLGSKSEYVFRNAEHSKLFKEEKAFGKRLIKEILLLIFPIVLLFINFLIRVVGFEIPLDNKLYIYRILFGVFPIFLVLTHILRFKRVKFVEIKDAKEGKGTRIRIVEFVLFFIYAFESIYVIYLVSLP